MQKFGLFFITVFSLFSCKPGDKSATSTVDKWVGKKIELPMVSKEIKRKRNLKIVTQINGYCYSCLQELKKWDDFIASIQQYDIDFLFYVITEDRIKIKELNKTNLHFEYPLIFDTTHRFENSNKIEDNDIFHTMLLNKANEVIIIGNPIKNNALKNLYREQIMKHIAL